MATIQRPSEEKSAVVDVDKENFSTGRHQLSALFIKCERQSGVTRACPLFDCGCCLILAVV